MIRTRPVQIALGAMLLAVPLPSLAQPPQTPGHAPGQSPANLPPLPAQSVSGMVESLPSAIAFLRKASPESGDSMGDVSVLQSMEQRAAFNALVGRFGFRDYVEWGMVAGRLFTAYAAIEMGSQGMMGAQISTPADMAAVTPYRAKIKAIMDQASAGDN